MLKYIGDGFIVGIPARDLSDEEVEQLGGEKYLVRTGLYERTESFVPSVLNEEKAKNKKEVGHGSRN